MLTKDVKNSFRLFHLCFKAFVNITHNRMSDSDGKMSLLWVRNFRDINFEVRKLLFRFLNSKIDFKYALN